MINNASPELSPRKAARASTQATQILRERIRSGFYKAQTWLPSERELAEDLHVYRRVIRDAIDELTREELIYRRPNCRPIIGRPAAQANDLPSAPANLAGSASKFVALIMWHGGGPLERAMTSQTRIFWGINHALGQVGHHGVFLDLGGEREGSYQRMGSAEQTAEREAKHLRYVMEKGFGGVIFYPYAYHSNSDLVQEVSRRMPVVLLDRKMPGVDVDFVGVNNRQAMFDMTTSLIEKGHRRIAYVTRCEPILPVQDRLQGYLAAIHQNRDLAVQEMVTTVPLPNEITSWPIVDAVFGLPPGRRPTAAVCINDYIAVLLSERLQRMGISVPGDVALAGFDDIVPTLPNGVGLTSAAQPFEEMGRVAVEILERRRQEPSRALESVEVPVQIVMRESADQVP